MATHSSVLAWRIPGTGEPGGLPSMELHGVRHDWSNLAAAAAAAAARIPLCLSQKCYYLIFSKRIYLVILLGETLILDREQNIIKYYRTDKA